ESKTTISPRSGSRTAGRRLWMIGTSAPYRNLFTKRKSPTCSVCRIDPDGMRNASTRKVRRNIQSTSAIAIERTQSTNHRTADRVRDGGAGGGVEVASVTDQSTQSAMKRL